MYTEMLGDRYLQTAHLNEVEKEMLRLSHMNVHADVLVVRA